MIRVAIVDDEPMIREQLQRFLDRFAAEQQEKIIVKTFHFPELFLNDYKPVYDIVMLDIDMPGMNGMEAARRMRQLDEKTILLFVTNLAQYALQGYEVDATDFIVKPVTYERFKYKMSRAVKRLARQERPRLLLRTEQGNVMISIDDVKYVEVQGHNVFYHTQKGVYRIRGSLKQSFEELDDPQFFICNKCYIVNLCYVAAVNGLSVSVDQDVIEVSRPKKKALMDALAAYHNRK